MEGIAKGESPGLNFEDGYRTQAVLEAVERSVENREWVRSETFEKEEG